MSVNYRTCGRCAQPIVEGQPDPCLGFIEGVSAACCGHGDDSQAYVSFYRPDGSFVAWDGGFTHMTADELANAESETRLVAAVGVEKETTDE